MDLSNLRPAEGSVKNEKRIGRGQGSGRGGTSTRGHKGARSRSGYKTKRGFEGGQMPLQRRVPKYGFKNFNRVEFRVINLAQLEELAQKNNITVFDFETFRSLKLIKASDKIKVLANGNLNSSLQISAHAFSTKAKEAIETAGGSIQIV